MTKVTGRRQAREWAVQFLFQTEFHSDDLELAMVDFWNDEDRNPSERDRTYVNEVVHGVMDKRREIDRTIAKYAQNWDVDRLGVLDRTIMRVATYEMLFRGDIPPVVSINEAVEIAKAYINKEAGRFVNGVLDRIQKELNRPARSMNTEK